LERTDFIFKGYRIERYREYIEILINQKKEKKKESLTGLCSSLGSFSFNFVPILFINYYTCERWLLLLARSYRCLTWLLMLRLSNCCIFYTTSIVKKNTVILDIISQRQKTNTKLQTRIKNPKLKQSLETNLTQSWIK